MAHRTHVSPSRHIRGIKPSEQNQDRNYNWKPRGFWYEVNGDWRRWLKGEGYNTSLRVGVRDYNYVGLKRVRSTARPRPMYLYRVHLNNCNVLKLSSVAMLDAFDRKYRSNERSGEFAGFTFHDYDIDWPRLATEYDGIEIAPYLWERRLSEECRWYYSWDCASGCLWRPQNATVSLIRRLV